MADGSKIEWTDATWNPITGCAIDTPGCINCYAMRLAGTRLRHHPSRRGLTRDTRNGPVWNGQVRLNREWLMQPLEWSKPRMIFVCAHGDLFYDAVPDDWIDEVFTRMALASQHTFQVLTKRAERMRRYLSGRPLQRWMNCATSIGRAAALVGRAGNPLPNVWLGVSTERQDEAWARIPHLLQTPAVVRYISAEPLIGPIDLENLGDVTMTLNALTGRARHLLGFTEQTMGKLDWVIVGGESGPRARPMDPAWARSLRDQCIANGKGTAFFMKQMARKAAIPRDLRIRQFACGNF